MLLKLYSGKKCFTTLVQYFDVDKVVKGEVTLKVREDHYAIPGMKVAHEDEVRKWATKEGFTVKKCY